MWGHCKKVVLCKPRREAQEKPDLQNLDIGLPVSRTACFIYTHTHTHTHTARSDQSIIKEIYPEYSLEGLMLNLKLQYLGHLM